MAYLGKCLPNKPARCDEFWGCCCEKRKTPDGEWRKVLSFWKGCQFGMDDLTFAVARWLLLNSPGECHPSRADFWDPETFTAYGAGDNFASCLNRSGGMERWREFLLDVSIFWFEYFARIDTNVSVVLPGNWRAVGSIKRGWKAVNCGVICASVSNDQQADIDPIRQLSGARTRENSRWVFCQRFNEFMLHMVLEFHRQFWENLNDDLSW